MKIRVLLLGAVHLIACANPGCAGRAEENGTAVATPKPVREGEGKHVSAPLASTSAVPEVAPDTSGGQQADEAEEAAPEPLLRQSIDEDGTIHEVQQEQFDFDFSNESEEVLHPKGPVVAARALGAAHPPARSESVANAPAIAAPSGARGDLHEVVSDRGEIAAAPSAGPIAETVDGAQLPGTANRLGPSNAGASSVSAGTNVSATRSAFLDGFALSQDVSISREGVESDAETAIPPGPLPMYGAVILHKVQDYEQWRSAFDDLMPERKRAGFVAQGVMRGLDDEKLVAVWLSVTDVAQAKAYFGNKQVRTRLTQAGMVGRPQVRLSSNVEARMEPGREGLTVALVALRVEDFSRFEAAFRGQAEARAAAGVVGYALSQDVTDAHRVYLYLQAENPLSFRKYLSAVATRARWRDAGMQGEPSVTLVREGELTLCR
ncbi:MAG: hypothetical protein RL701_2937 [Pseudomonadota bacterium]